MDTGNLRRASRESSSVLNPQRASCLLAFAQISPQLARLPPPLLATVKPCLGSGERTCLVPQLGSTPRRARLSLRSLCLPGLQA